MITFRKKNTVQDLIPEALKYLKEQGIYPNLIKLEDADDISKTNCKSMVLISFIKNERGYYQIQLKDKKLYNYTLKLLRDVFRMRVLNVDKKTRIITAETDHLGVILDIIEILGTKYDLSVVSN